MKDVAKLICFRFFFELRSRIGDRNETAAGFLRPDRLLNAIEEILFEDVWLERAAGFAGNDEQRLCQVNLAFECLDLRGIGRVEHMKPRETWNLTKSLFQNFRA